MEKIEYNIVIDGEVKAVAREHRHKVSYCNFIETSMKDIDQKMQLQLVSVDAHRLPVGTKVTVEVPMCPKCGISAYNQNKENYCECGYDWLTFENDEKTHT